MNLVYIPFQTSEAAGNSGQIRAHRRADPAKRQKRKAGSLPIAAYCQFETLARGALATPLRVFARSMCAFSLAISVRAVDALRTVEDADDVAPDTVMSEWSYFSKDGEPMKTYAKARGFTGDYEWWPVHRDAVRAAGRAFPKQVGTALRGQRQLGPSHGPAHAFRAAQGTPCCLDRGVPQGAAALVERRGVQGLVPDGALGARIAFRHASNLRCPLAVWRLPPGACARDRPLGLRLGGLEEQLEGGTAGTQARRRGAGAGRQATGAFANNAAECAAAYCQGQGREGRRTAQVRVRKRWVDAVRAALRASGKTWLELPKGRADYDILRPGEAEE